MAQYKSFTTSVPGVKYVEIEILERGAKSTQIAGNPDIIWAGKFAWMEGDFIHPYQKLHFEKQKFYPPNLSVNGFYINVPDDIEGTYYAYGEPDETNWRNWGRVFHYPGNPAR